MGLLCHEISAWLMLKFHWQNIISQNGCTSLHPYQQCKRNKVPSYPSQNLAFQFLNFSNSSVYTIDVLIWISLVTSDAKHLFMWLLAIHIFSFVKYNFNSFAH